MPPLWFAAPSAQTMGPMRPNSQGRGPGGSAMGIPRSGPVPAPAPYPRPGGPLSSMRPQHFGPGGRGPPRPMGPMPPGGPMHRGPLPVPGKGRPFVSGPPPPMRMTAFGNDHLQHAQTSQDMRARMSFPPPHMQRPFPPQHPGMMRNGLPPGVHRLPGPMAPPAGPPHIHPSVQAGIMLSVPVDSPPEAHAQAPAPLRELQNHNILQQTQPGAAILQKMETKPTDSGAAEHQDAATDAAEILLGLRAIPSPPPPLEAKIEKRDDSPNVAETSQLIPSRLAVRDDGAKLNSMHCFLRSELLELFVVENKSPKNGKSTNDCAGDQNKDYKVGSASGRVGLRCVHCAKARLRNGSSDGEAPMAVFYPKSIAELYRLVTSWQRVHLRKCRNLPPTVREKYEKTRQDKSRGKTQWWVASAYQIGLVDCRSKAGGIRFAPTTPEAPL